MLFKKNQKVVCIDGTPDKTIVTDEIYTVRGYARTGAVLLYSVRERGNYFGQVWWGFNEHRFRPFDNSFGEETLKSINFKEEEHGMDKQLQSA